MKSKGSIKAAAKRPAQGRDGRQSVRKRDKEASKRKLLDAALEVFSRLGYDAATTKEIARLAGVNEALIPRYFEGKNGLLLAILQAFAETEARSACDLPGLQPSVAADLRLFFDHGREHAAEKEGFFRVAVSRAIVDPRVGGLLRDHIVLQMMPVALERLRQFQRQGEIRKGEDLESMAFGICALSFSFWFLGDLVGCLDGKRMRKALGQASEVLAAGLRN